MLNYRKLLIVHLSYVLLFIFFLGNPLLAEDKIETKAIVEQEQPKDKSQASAEKEPKVISEQSESKQEGNFPYWTESLVLKDFYLLGSFLELKAKLNNYVKTLQEEYKNNPDAFSTAIEYGQVLIDIGDIEKADLVWTRAVQVFKSNPTPKVYKAWVDALKGNYQSAKEIWYPYLKERIEVGIVGSQAGIWLPHHTDAIIGLYLIKDYLEGQDKKNIEEKVLLIANNFPNHPRFNAILISEDLKVGRFKTAAEKLQRMLESYPEEPVTITLLGITQLLTGHYDEALKLFTISSMLNPYSPTTRLMKARTLYAFKKEKESMAELELVKNLYSRWDLSSTKKMKKLLDSKSYLTIPKSKYNSAKKTKEKEIKAATPEIVPESKRFN